MVRLWLLSITGVLFLAATMRLTNSGPSFWLSTVYATLFLLLLSVILFKKIDLKFNSFIIFLISLFFIFGLMSAPVNSDRDIFFRIIMLTILLIVSIIFIPSYFREDTEKILIRLILISQIPILIIPIIIDRGIDRTPYFGMFSNTNSLGGVAVTVLVVFTAFLLRDVEKMLLKRKTSKKYIYLNLLFIASLLLLITYSTSRTSFVTALVVIFTGISLVLINVFRHRKIGNLIFKLIIIGPATALLFFILDKFIPLTESINNNIISKFERKASDLLDGRSVVWNETVENAGLFGGGSNFFYIETSIGAHNTFIAILGQYGWIPMIVFILIMLAGLYYSFIRFFKSESKYKYFAPLMLINFITLSMAEDMSYKLSFIVALSIIGVCINNARLVIGSNLNSISRTMQSEETAT